MINCDLFYREKFLKILLKRSNKRYLILCDEVGFELSKRILFSKRLNPIRYDSFKINYIYHTKKGDYDKYLTVYNETGKFIVKEYDDLELAIELFDKDIRLMDYEFNNPFDTLAPPKNYEEAVRPIIKKVVI